MCFLSVDVLFLFHAWTHDAWDEKETPGKLLYSAYYVSRHFASVSHLNLQEDEEKDDVVVEKKYIWIFNDLLEMENSSKSVIKRPI